MPIGQVEQQRPLESQNYLAFRLQGIVLGIPATALDEIMAASCMLPLANVAAHIAGIVEWRSQMLTVLHGGRVILGSNEVLDPQSSCLIVLHTDYTVGLWVDDVIGFVEVANGAIEPVKPAHIAKDNYCSGMVENLFVLELQTILADPLLQVDQ